MNQILKENYLDASLPDSLSGASNFSRAFKEREIKVTQENLNDYLSSEPTYSNGEEKVQEK